MNKIKQKIQEIGLSQRQISTLLGRNASYLAGVMRSGLSTEKQAELLRELDMVAKGEPIKTDSEIIAELSQRLTLTQKYLMEANGEVCELKARLKKANRNSWIIVFVCLVCLVVLGSVA